MCNKNSLLRQSLFKVEQHNKELRDENADLKSHIDHLQYIIKVLRTKVYEKEHYRKNL